MQVNEIFKESQQSKKDRLLIESINKSINKDIRKSLSSEMYEFHKVIFESLSLSDRLNFPLNEATATGRGDYVGFNYEYNANNPRAGITVRFPDGRTTRVRNRQEATQVSDEWNQRNRAPAPRSSDNDGGSDRSQTGDRENRSRPRGPRHDAFRTQFRTAFNRPFNPLRSIRGGLLGGFAVAMGVQLTNEAFDLDGRILRGLGIDVEEGAVNNVDTLLENYWIEAQAGTLIPLPKPWQEMSDTEQEDHLQRNRQLYENIVATVYGISMAAVAPFVIRAVVRIVTNTSRGLRQFVRYLKASRNIITAAAAGAGAILGAGIGGIVSGLISFIISSAAIWMVQIALSRSDLADTVIAYIVIFLYKRDRENFIEGGDWTIPDIGERVGDRTRNILRGGAEIVGADSLADQLENVRLNLLNDPRADQETRDAASALSRDAVRSSDEPQEPDSQTDTGSSSSNSGSSPEPASTRSSRDLGIVPTLN